MSLKIEKVEEKGKFLLIKTNEGVAIYEKKTGKTVTYEDADIAETENYTVIAGKTTEGIKINVIAKKKKEVKGKEEEKKKEEVKKKEEKKGKERTINPVVQDFLKKNIGKKITKEELMKFLKEKKLHPNTVGPLIYWGYLKKSKEGYEVVRV